MIYLWYFFEEQKGKIINVHIIKVITCGSSENKTDPFPEKYKLQE